MMKAEILTIGDEILIGQITNTNSVWIAQQLNMAGIRVSHMASVADDEKAIAEAFDSAAKRADLVLITGGLGPTKDDITKLTFSNYFNAALEINKDVLEDVTRFFTQRGKEITEINRKQALIPNGCVVIRNANGTAPGMWMQKDKTIFISMPGVPYEMKAMVTDFILPKLEREYTLDHIYHKTVLTTGIGESVLAELIEKWEDNLASKNIKLAYLPQPGMVRLRLSSYGNNQEALKQNIEEEIKNLIPLIEKYFYGFENYGEENNNLEQEVSRLLRERNKTVALAESCTGGYISSLFTAIPGASDVFKGAVVPYTNEAKHTLLEVDKNVFATTGAVSKECVEQLAENVLKKFNSDYAIAVSGIAGPSGGSAEKPVGLVWIAVADKNGITAQRFQFGDNRQRNIIMSAAGALNMLRKLILTEAF
ncbi:MAG: competence/damage-inducible protein A [Bacteroidetes bacterium]|nr:competence/damage-inducible protein A [Bacteroidota bacterium]